MIFEEKKQYTAFHYSIGAIIFLVSLLDTWDLPMMAITLGTYFVVGYLIRRRKIDPLLGFSISSLVFYLYSFFGTKFYQMSEQATPLIFGVLALSIYWIVNRQREITYKKIKKFASIGRQAAFLLHELKSPLSRFMMSNSEKNNKDAEYILAIVEGVELLISERENLSFKEFDWKEIQTYLENEFEFYCKHYGITLKISGFDEKGYGHCSTIKLALNNLVKNAVEAIANEKIQGSINVTRKENFIEVSNNGSVITQEKIKHLFKPFYSGKNTKNNLGLGLHFVESVVRAHNGHIDVQVDNGRNIFKIEFGQAI